MSAFATAPALADPLEGKKSSAEILAAAAEGDWRSIEDENLLIISLGRGDILIALSDGLAQKHVAQVKTLAREGFYDGLSFYRVIDGFVAQGGDPFGERKISKAKKKMTAEFTDAVNADFSLAPVKDQDGYAPQVGFLGAIPTGYDAAEGAAWHLHCAGAFAFGREDARDTASTEFYIALQPQRYLDRNLSVFGRVIEGMEHLQALRRVSPPESKDDDIGETIVSMRVAADIAEEQRPHFEYLDTKSEAFAAYVEARRNRPEGFFHFRPDHLDICQLPFPVRRKATL